MKNIAAILLIVTTWGLFYIFINPTYGEVQTLRVEDSAFSEALDNTRVVQQLRDDVLSKYNSFPRSDIARIEKLLPDHIDNVRLIIEIDSIAARYNMILKDVKLSQIERAIASVDTLGTPDGTVPYGVADIGFSVSGPYEVFLTFLDDLERSLRIMDIGSVSFTSPDAENVEYDYDVQLYTYWLKQS